MQLDLNSLAEVKKFSDTFKQSKYGGKLDVLINNAGTQNNFFWH
jgi:NAD(P)-dependent dehydrogenase (short-subunit alcohol dehydrogenase family)